MAGKGKVNHAHRTSDSLGGNHEEILVDSGSSWAGSGLGEFAAGGAELWPCSKAAMELTMRHMRNGVEAATERHTTTMV